MRCFLSKKLLLLHDKRIIQYSRLRPAWRRQTFLYIKPVVFCRVLSGFVYAIFFVIYEINSALTLFFAYFFAQRFVCALYAVFFKKSAVGMEGENAPPSGTLTFCKKIFLRWGACLRFCVPLLCVFLCLLSVQGLCVVLVLFWHKLHNLIKLINVGSCALFLNNSLFQFKLRFP